MNIITAQKKQVQSTERMQQHTEKVFLPGSQRKLSIQIDLLPGKVTHHFSEIF